MLSSAASAQAAQVVPQGTVDHRMRATGSGYAGGPTATTAKGVPADLAAGHVAPPQPPSSHPVGRLDFKA